MREQDIKKLFNLASEGEESNANSDEIKKSVLEKLGKNGLANLNAEGESVEPVFVTAPKKNGKITALKITAGAAAACLGIAFIGNAVYHSGGLSALMEVDAANFTPDYELFLLDGKNFKYDGYTDSFSAHRGTETESKLLSEENGRLYFIKNAGEISRGISDKPVKEDITDKISSGSCYIYSYDNPDNTVFKTHSVIIGGDIANNDYGYIELYKINNDGLWRYEFMLSKDIPHSGNGEEEKKAAEEYLEAPWIADGIKKLEKQYGEEIIANFGGSGGSFGVDFRNAWAISAENMPAMELHLLDGSLIKCSTNGETPIVGFEDISSSHLLSEENGRLYFVNNAGRISSDNPREAIKEDITDKISSDNFYLFTYANHDNIIDQTHYIIVGGDIAGNDYGYAEVFKAGIGNTWGMVGKYSKEAPERPPLVNDSGTSGMPQWLINGIRKLEDELGESEIMRNGSGSIHENIDFTNTWSTEGKTANTENPDLEFYLLDGTLFQYFDNYNGDTAVDCNYSAAVPILSEENGRLYFVKNAGEVARGIADTPIKEDITNEISSGDCWIYAYDNPNNNVYQRHYIIVSGDISEGLYEYAEWFKVNEEEWDSVSAFGQYSFSRYSGTEGKQRRINDIKKLEEKFGENIIGHKYGGQAQDNINFKDVWANY